MSYDNEPLLQNVIAPLGSVQPLGDLLLVRRLPDAEMEGSLVIPPISRDGQYGQRRGIVVAVGPGDRLFRFICGYCGAVREVTERIVGFNTDHPEHWIMTGERCDTPMTTSRPPAPETWMEPCGGPWEYSGWTHCPMHAKVGDEIVFVRVPANDVTINGEDLTFTHEEGHVMAILEGAEFRMGYRVLERQAKIETIEYAGE